MKTKPTTPRSRMGRLPAHSAFILLTSVSSPPPPQTARLVSVTAVEKTAHPDPKSSIGKVVKKHREIERCGGAKLQGEVKMPRTFF